jgi:hypothetical protein
MLHHELDDALGLTGMAFGLLGDPRTERPAPARELSAPISFFTPRQLRGHQRH